MHFERFTSISIKKYFLVMALFCLSTSRVFADDLLGQAIQQEMIRQHTPGVVMSVIQNGKTVYRKAFGVADLKTNRPVTPSTYFHFASITKTFTSVAVMQLVHAGVIQLDAPIVEYLPWFQMQGDKNIWQKINVGQLLSHTAGLPRDFAVDFWMNMNRLASGDIPNSEELHAGLSRQSLTFIPGTKLKYSNMGFCILGELVAQKGGAPGSSPAERYQNYIRAHIFAPLGMNHSSFEMNDLNHSALPYALALPNRAQLPVLENSGAYVGAWGLVSNTEDMELYAKWLLAVSRGTPNPILPPQVLAEMIVPHMRDAVKPQFGYGLGFMTQDFSGASPRFYHSGTYPGYRTFLSFDPAQNFAVVFMSNAIDTNREAFVDLAYQVMAIAPKSQPELFRNPQSPILNSSQTLTPDLAHSYLNTNEVFSITTNTDDNSLVVNEGGDNLALRFLAHTDRLWAYQMSANGFYADWLGEKMVFEVDSVGNPICALVGGAYEQWPAQKLSSQPSQLCGSTNKLAYAPGI